MAPPELFLSLVRTAVRTRDELSVPEYLTPALNVARRIPEGMHPGDAAAMFVRWIHREPFQGQDEMLWRILTPDK